MPYAGLNPIPAAARFLAGLPALERQLRRGVRSSRLLGVPHVTPTVCRAPASGLPQNNVIPSTVEVRIDVRLVPGLAPRTVLAALRALARETEASCRGVRVAVAAIEPPRPAVRVPRTQPIVQAVEWAVATVTGRAPQFGGVPGTTDGTIFVTERGIPIVTFGPGNREVPHQVDEFVEVAQLAEAARCYAAAALRFLGAAPGP
jgi:succinyl-diaminopimelate desuccinylase